MNNVIFGYTPDEISDLGYQKADVEKACSILRNIVGLIRRKGLNQYIDAQIRRSILYQRSR